MNVLRNGCHFVFVFFSFSFFFAFWMMFVMMEMMKIVLVQFVTPIHSLLYPSLMFGGILFPEFRLVLLDERHQRDLQRLGQLIELHSPSFPVGNGRVGPETIRVNLGRRMIVSVMLLPQRGDTVDMRSDRGGKRIGQTKQMLGFGMGGGDNFRGQVMKAIPKLVRFSIARKKVGGHGRSASEKGNEAQHDDFGSSDGLVFLTILVGVFARCGAAVFARDRVSRSALQTIEIVGIVSSSCCCYLAKIFIHKAAIVFVKLFDGTIVVLLLPLLLLTSLVHGE
mmetsp:Transcript_7814/g.16207  ORF Transcript_7814/g.16207 Transcript_7814/m.16207 type:complete len:280 (-) Transcript_7814:101-940(-)